MTNESKKISHAWQATWKRPMKIDETDMDPFTVARMTDHNVRGHDDDEPEIEQDRTTDDDELSDQAA